jgi:hypothetical protein
MSRFGAIADRVATTMYDSILRRIHEDMRQLSRSVDRHETNALAHPGDTRYVSELEEVDRVLEEALRVI